MQVGLTKMRNELVQRAASSRAHQHAAQAASDTGADARMEEEEEEEAGGEQERQKERNRESAPVLQTGDLLTHDDLHAQTEIKVAVPKQQQVAVTRSGDRAAGETSNLQIISSSSSSSSKAAAGCHSSRENVC